MKILLVPILALSLAGCIRADTPVDPLLPVVPVISNIVTPAVVVQHVVNGAIRTCDFAPQADFVLDLINTSITTGVNSWVQAICDAVALIPRSTGPRSASRTPRSVPVPKVNGIPLQGRYVG
jgi:hypothetical protein